MIRRIHSVPFNGDWAVKKEGVKTPLSKHYTQEKAENMARMIAKYEKTEAVYHNKHGRIKDSDSFGNDPCPPKDTKN